VAADEANQNIQPKRLFSRVLMNKRFFFGSDCAENRIVDFVESVWNICATNCRNYKNSLYCDRVRTFASVQIMANTYPKNEKLKSRITIDALFSQGKSVSKYPLRLVYIPQVFEDDVAIKIGVSVSKKYFRKAVDRNYYKRLLRECYRLNKSLLLSNLAQPYAFMLMYQSKDRLSFEEIQLKTVQLFEKFHDAQK
jgi:ribonuclease P protein component